MKLSVVIPCYNEEEIIEQANLRLQTLIYTWIKNGLIDESETVYVNDGSQDKTSAILKQIAEDDITVKVISFSSNFGHQSALIAGIRYASGNAIVSLDADLQDPPEIIEEMLKKFKQGSEIVYGVRKSRHKDSLFKRLTAQYYYKLMRFMGVNLIYDHADFRLISKRVKEELERFVEVNLFLRGIFPKMGFEQSTVEYERKERLAGDTKYPLKKMLSFAIEGITSFTYFPLRLIAVSGCFLFVASLLLSFWAIITKLFGNTVPGWASIVIPTYLLGGVQLMFLGIVGEYIGKIYVEIKKRPLYIVRETINI